MMEGCSSDNIVALEGVMGNDLIERQVWDNKEI